MKLNSTYISRTAACGHHFVTFFHAFFKFFCFFVRTDISTNGNYVVNNNDLPYQNIAPNTNTPARDATTGSRLAMIEACPASTRLRPFV